MWTRIVVGTLGVMLFVGCSAPQGKWNPTRMEMKQLIGQTTMEAIHAYRIATERAMVEQGIEKLEKLEDEKRMY